MSPFTKISVECYGGPLDGSRMRLSGQSLYYSYMVAGSGLYHLYRMDKLRGGLFYIGVEIFDEYEGPQP